MKKLLKIILYFFAVVFLFLIFFTMYHHIALKKEAKSIKANGILVTVDGHKMHIYSEGSKNNKPTIVLMSGSGVAAPVYDYKVLYSKLSDEYHVVVIEKFGYGYSDISGLPRDIDTLVREDREALKLAGESEPVCAHASFNVMLGSFILGAALSKRSVCYCWIGYGRA